VAGVLGGLRAACAAGGWWPWKVLPIGSDASLLPLKIGLDNGGHFPRDHITTFGLRDNDTHSFDNGKESSSPEVATSAPSPVIFAQHHNTINAYRSLRFHHDPTRSQDRVGSGCGRCRQTIEQTIRGLDSRRASARRGFAVRITSYPELDIFPCHSHGMRLRHRTSASGYAGLTLMARNWNARSERHD
jgi:hypothetical protein